MTAQEFMRLEHLSMRPFTFLSLASASFLFFLLFILLATKGPYKKPLVIFFTLLSGLALALTLVVHAQIQDYAEISKYIHAGLRDRQAGPLAYTYLSTRQQKSLQSLYRPESLEKIPFYQREEIIVPLDYRGLRRPQEKIFFLDSNLVFSFETSLYKDIDQAQMVLYQYTLKDRELLEEGFKEKTRPFFIRLELPLASQGLTFVPDPEDHLTEISLQNSFPAYLFP